METNESPVDVPVSLPKMHRHFHAKKIPRAPVLFLTPQNRDMFRETTSGTAASSRPAAAGVPVVSGSMSSGMPGHNRTFVRVSV